MNQDWSIRAYKNGDEQAMFELYRAVYGEVTDKVRWMRHWHWKFMQTPAGAAVIWLPGSNEKIVGQYPINRVKMEVGNEVIEGSQMVELMTHPDYQHQGIFLTLARLALSDARDKGIDITYGFPNEAAYPGHLKSGYSDVGSISAMIKPLNLENVLRKYITNQSLLKISTAILNLAIKAFYRTRKVPEVDGLTITRVSSFDERINDLWARVSSNYEIMVRRDEAYLNWRYVEVPNVSYAIYLAEKKGQTLGYTVLKCEEQLELTVGRIFELVVIAGKKAIAQSLLLKAIEFFKEEKADIILYRLIGNKSLYGALRKSGFIYSRFASRKVRFIAHSNTAQIPEAFIKEPSYWFVQTGDSDAI